MSSSLRRGRPSPQQLPPPEHNDARWERQQNHHPLHHEPQHRLDLHGYTKSEAIRSLTDFLDNVSRHRHRQQRNDLGSVWCLVITGTGAHSPDGPVLRGAVQSLFQKRQMMFELNKGGGSFVVDACSGIVLTKEEPTNSKVVVATPTNEFGTIPNPTSYRTKKTKAGWSSSSSVSRSMDEQQVALQKTYRSQQNEEKALKRAVSQSIVDSEQQQKEDDDKIQQVIRQSIHDNKDVLEEEKQVHEALKCSTEELERHIQEEESLQKLLEVSRKEYEQEENDLLKVMELSLQDQQEEDNELLKVMKLSTLDY